MAEKSKKPELIQTAKGMRDILPFDYMARLKFLEKAKNIAEYYGFKPIHTPYLEKEDLFTAGVGQNTEIIEKQMYTLKTRGGDKLALRPEGTASVMRSYLQNGMQHLPQPVMLFYDGFFFRHERPQRGRQRELHQFGMEIIGEGSSIADAIIIKTCLLILEEAGLKSLKLHINSIGDGECRNTFKKELAAYYRKKAGRLCEDCKRRIKTNPLRLLDCKEEKCQEIKKEAPQMMEFLCEDCKKHLKELLEILDASKIDYYLDHHLVRGLDYYTRTVFEIFQDEGMAEDEADTAEGKPETLPQEEIANEKPKKLQPLALAGGGRYDMLAKMLGGKNFPAVGCALGIDRVMSLIKEKQKFVPKEKNVKVFFIQLGTVAKQKSLNVLEVLRKGRIPVRHSLNKDGLKGQLKIAARIKSPYTLIFGQKEAMDDTMIVRNMDTVAQETIPISKLVDYLKKRL